MRVIVAVLVACSLALQVGSSRAASRPTPRMDGDISAVRGPNAVLVPDRPSEYARDLKVYTFENGTGGPSTEGWITVDSTGFGNFAGLVDGTTVLQEDPSVTNNTHFWAFFNGSTENYGCGGHAGQAAVPHGNFFNIAASPWIDLSVDKDGTPYPPDFTGVDMGFEVYRDLPFDNLVFYTYQIRFQVGGIPTAWQNENFVYYGNQKRWLGFRSGGFEIPSGATHVQVSVGAIDMCFVWCGIYGTGACHSHAPLIDNVHVTRTMGLIYTVGNVGSYGSSGGTLSLHEAIIRANARPGKDVIVFNIPGPGPHTITLTSLFPPTSNFPTITDDLLIDGFSQPGSSPNTNPVGSPSNAQIDIVVDGSASGSTDGFNFENCSGTLRGIATHGWSSNAVRVTGHGVVIEGCYIGTNAGGQTAATQNATGILVASDDCRIGGATPAARNVIANSQYGPGILMVGGIAGTEIYGNYIGVGADGITPAGNAYAGIRIADGPTGARIGSSVLVKTPNPEEANVIAHNGQYGVVVQDDVTFDNLIIGNSIHDNGTQAIDLSADGVTPNDAGDADNGPNRLQNFPGIDYATGFDVSGTMVGAPNANFVLHFYRATRGGDAKVFMGGLGVSTDGTGYAGFGFTSPQPIPPGSYVTATATDETMNTSELAASVVSNNTPAGSNVSVALMDGDVQRGVVTFEEVMQTGNTYLTTPYTPHVLLSGGFYAGNPEDPAIYMDIWTDAEYKNVAVCINYNEHTIPGPEAALQLVHYNGAYWQAVTTSVDLVNNTVCGWVSSLSPFVIAVSTLTPVNGTPTPESFALHANVPNPFNPITTIVYDVPAGGANVDIAIYDVAGRLVRELVNEHRNAGAWSVQWNGEDDRGGRVASGVYFYRMRAGSFVETKKMVLLK